MYIWFPDFFNVAFGDKCGNINDTEDNIEPGDEHIQSLRIVLNAEIQHNKTLIEKKRLLETALNNERKKQAELGEQVVLLEQELSQ